MKPALADRREALVTRSGRLREELASGVQRAASQLAVLDRLVSVAKRVSSKPILFAAVFVLLHATPRRMLRISVKALKYATLTAPLWPWIRTLWRAGRRQAPSA
jgi:hypothetical protein